MSKRKSVVFDDDNPEWTEEDFARARPSAELPSEVRAAFEKARKLGQRGPGKKPRKVQVTFRIDPDVADAIKATGIGYAMRVNNTLRKAFVVRGRTSMAEEGRRNNVANLKKPVAAAKRTKVRTSP